MILSYVCVQERVSTGMLTVSAKFQVVGVPSLSDKIVVMKWHTVQAHGSKDRDSHHSGTASKHHDRHDSTGLNSTANSARRSTRDDIKQQSQALCMACDTDADSEDGEQKPKLRFNMDAERRYSVNAVPLYEPSRGDGTQPSSRPAPAGEHS